MDSLHKKEMLNALKIFKVNPYTKLESFLRERKTKKEEKLLRLKMAVFSGGIKKMK
jgi:hypothetical protein